MQSFCSCFMRVLGESIVLIRVRLNAEMYVFSVSRVMYASISRSRAFVNPDVNPGMELFVKQREAGAEAAVSVCTVWSEMSRA